MPQLNRLRGSHQGHAKVTYTVNIAINVIWYPNCILLPFMIF